MIIMTIGENIKELRKKNKMTQKELANSLGVRQSTLSSWETGVNKADTDMLQRIADIFQVELYELLTGCYNPSFYKEWTKNTEINLEPLPQLEKEPSGQCKAIPYVKEYRVENDKIVRVIDGYDWVTTSRTGDLVFYELPSPNLFQQGFYTVHKALVRENARRFTKHAFIVASVDNGPVGVYRITVSEENKMDFILDTMDSKSFLFFPEDQIKRVKIIGEILEVHQILNNF